MGGRGAASGLKYDKYKGYSSYGKKYGSEYRTVLQVDNIKFIKPVKGGAKVPEETRGGSKRVYVAVDNMGELKALATYGKNGQRQKQIDLKGYPHTTKKGEKIPTPHTHLGYLHDEGGTRPKMTKKEVALVEKAKRLWETYKRGK